MNFDQIPTPESDEVFGSRVNGIRSRKCRDLERRLTVAREALGRLEKLSLCGRAYEEIEQTLTQTAPKQ